MSLRDYERKRRFTSTPEPSAGSGGRGGHRPIFVVQLHHARARHYDFRLEVDGALKSWAVPKGPSLRPSDKRLAVEVEDHPLAYADFEGDIPEGEYGAGTVTIFDRGAWSAENDPASAIAAGELDFSLYGTRLKGRWKLVRTRRQGTQRQWLLIKRDDGYARNADADELLAEKPAKRARSPSAHARNGDGTWRKRAQALAGARARPFSAGFKPQLATLRAAAPAGDGWLHEVKWDGYRMLADLDHRKVKLRSRNDLDWTTDFPDIAAAIESLPVSQGRFDGELVALDRNGRSDFAALQRTLKGVSTAPLRYLLFDLPGLADIDLAHVALIERKTLLESLLAHDESGALAFSSHIIGHGPEVFEASGKQGLEGIISKRVDARYSQHRSGAWVKVKHETTDEFVIVGHTVPKGSRIGFGSLLMARSENGVLHYAGRVGTGYSDNDLRGLSKRLAALRDDRQAVSLPSHIPFSVRSVRWVKPELVAEVAFRGVGSEGLLRQAGFVRVRDDKTPEDLGVASTRKSKKPAPEKNRQQRSARSAPGVTITHPERRMFAGAPYTKADVADYYRAVADYLLPELTGRPVSLLRCPQGARGECFFQKHHAGTLGDAVHSVRLKEKDGTAADYICIDDLDGLLDLVQMNVIEFHPWGSHADDPERPDRLVFDLDPAPGIAWDDIVSAARDVRARLHEAGLDSFVRLSGGKGLHVVAPIRRGPDWETVRDFCEAFAQAMVMQKPATYVATMSKAKRRGRIFIDWLRNGRGATSVTGWSLRARPGAPVAMPLRWEELGAVDRSATYDLMRAKRRAASLRRDPWEDVRTSKQALPEFGE